MLETQRLTEERQHRKAAAQHRRQPGARGRRRGARPADRGAPVNEDAVKLTSYFGERQPDRRRRFAADALLDLYGRHEVATSILLRGAEGFGASRRLAHRPVADPVGGPAADRGRGRHAGADRAAGRADRAAHAGPGWSPWSGPACVRGRRHRAGAARGGARADQAHHLPGPPGAGVPGARLHRRLRPAAPAWHRRGDGAARRGRHRARAAASAPPSSAATPRRR